MEAARTKVLMHKGSSCASDTPSTGSEFREPLHKAGRIAWCAAPGSGGGARVVERAIPGCRDDGNPFEQRATCLCRDAGGFQDRIDRGVGGGQQVGECCVAQGTMALHLAGLHAAALTGGLARAQRRHPDHPDKVKAIKGSIEAAQAAEVFMKVSFFLNTESCFMRSRWRDFHDGLHPCAIVCGERERQHQ